MAQIKKFIIVIPFYKNEKYIHFFIDWYKKNISEHKLIDQVVVINDYPLSHSKYLQKKCAENNFKYILNKRNIGYLESANIALEIARSKNKHLVLMNSDTLPYGNFLSELYSCFISDSNLGIIGPRSNNATINNLYDEPRLIKNKNSINEFISDFLNFKKLAPKISYTPVITGFCFCIRNDIVKIFGDFDTLFSPGYEEENDYCFRVSQRGIRVGIANHAFVAHLEGMSFSISGGNRDRLKLENYQKILKKHPYFPDLLSQYNSSENSKAVRKISLSLKSGDDILVDASNLGAYFNGTNKLICEFLIALNKLGYSVDLIANQTAIKFHKLHRLTNLRFLDKPSKIYKYGIRIGQPFDVISLRTVTDHSIFSTCIFFDVIAADCPQLSSASLSKIWASMPHSFTSISFISTYSKDQFIGKFGNGNSRLEVALLPLVTRPAKQKSMNAKEGNKEIVIIVGNQFKHKGIDIALTELPKIKNRIYYALSETFETKRDDVKFLPPGYISEDKLSSLMNAAKFIIFPTFSEGFGFPILEALQYKKDIYCRALPPFIEIYNSIDHQLKHFIKFVPNFKLDGSMINLKPRKNPGVFFNNYVDYVKHVIETSHNIPASELFEHSKLQFKLTDQTNTYEKYNNFLDVILYPANKFISKYKPLHNLCKKIAKHFGINPPIGTVRIKF
jgi:GT2 family glycosyltransferase